MYYRSHLTGIYKIALTHKKLGITKEMLANKILPFLFPVCIESTLNLSQVDESWLLQIKMQFMVIRHSISVQFLYVRPQGNGKSGWNWAQD